MRAHSNDLSSRVAPILEFTVLDCTCSSMNIQPDPPRTNGADRPRLPRMIHRLHSLEWYREQIARYDAAEAASVCARVRCEAGLESAVDPLLAIYARSLSEHTSVQRRADHCLASQRAGARHFASIAQELKNVHVVAARRSLHASWRPSGHR